MNDNSFKPFFLDSLSLKKTVLPLPTNKETPISIYACGITPYSDAHIGHARSYIVFDLLANTFRNAGFKAKLVRNITDIDDKIIAAAEKHNLKWFELSDIYSQKARELMVKTGLIVPEEPKASEYLPDIFKLIEKLLSLGHAYIADGDVLYDVKSYKGNRLMNHKEGALKSEQGISRVDTSNKKDSRDFALWKSMPEDSVGFESPWGWGRPGWHIECSAMIGNIFDGHVDIHGGGVDLKFPHHEAEIMQSEPAWGKPLAKLWMHNGSVLSNGVKMSKSLNNYVTWHDALEIANKKHDGLGGDILKLALLGTHWQKPLDWKEQSLDEAYDFLKLISLGMAQKVEQEILEKAKLEIVFMLGENLNTPKVFALIKSRKSKEDFSALVQAFAQVLNLKISSPIKEEKNEIFSEEVVELIKKRNQARLEKNWVLADEIRLKLKHLGINQADNSLS
jgi:cysteinyl-tRNA synthetase